jgi:hypothetical protein
MYARTSDSRSDLKSHELCSRTSLARFFFVIRNAAYCSQAEKEKKDKEDGYFTAPETITFGDNYWQMHHNKLAKRAKQMDD